MGSMAVPAIPLKNLSQQFDLLGHELVVDTFAGGDGATEGIQQALGHPVDLAINHRPMQVSIAGNRTYL